PVARPSQPLRLRHGRLPHLARRPTADLHRRARRPHRAVHQGKLVCASRVAPTSVTGAARAAQRTVAVVTLPAHEMTALQSSTMHPGSAGRLLLQGPGLLPIVLWAADG